ncbi:MAG TPA: mechanosensitive ion channel family protein [Anaerolineaceae bacterium]|nr:mechanosensitive ion channel family protein [Anaerolineaceae bacterium]
MDFNQWFQGFLQRALDFIPHLIVALLVFAFSLLIARPASRWVERGVRLKITDESLVQLLTKLTRWLIIITGTIIALDQVDFDITGFIAGLGIVSLIVGFALQDITRNFIAGVILLLRKPFKLGDDVEIAGHKGSVININTRDTILKGLDGEVVILPNINVFNAAIFNFTDLPHNRRTIRIGLGYSENITHASRIFLETIQAVPGVLDTPAPTILAEELGDSNLTLVARFWVNRESSNPLQVHSDVVTALKEVAEKEGIDLPYPIQVVKVEK